MDAAGVDVHVLSATPQTYMYDQEAAVGVAASVLQNDQMAAHIAAHPDRFMGIATLPMQAPEKAADELKRAMTKKGLKGAMFGSNVMGKNLDDPSFEPLWATAEELGAFMVIHPTTVAGSDRLKSYYLRNLIGNPLDTTIAAASLYFGGVLDRHPKLNFVLVHGGGFTPYPGRALGARLARAAGAEGERQDRAQGHRQALLLRYHPCIRRRCWSS